MDKTETFQTSISSVNQAVPKEAKNVYIFAKQMLQSRLFVGTFQEKRYVDKLKSYRDVISVSNEESDLIKDFQLVKKRVANYFHDRWVGISEPKAVGAHVNCFLWVELSEEVFGKYWYKINKVKFRDNEVLLRVKIIRPFVHVDKELENSVSETVKKIKEIEIDDDNAQLLDFQERISVIFNIIKKSAMNGFLYFTTNVITLENTREALKFVSILLATTFTGMIQFLAYLGDFVLKFTHEASFFIKSASPIFIACVNLIGKIVGGFYLLIAMMWRDRNGSPVYQSPYIERNSRAITYGGYKSSTTNFNEALPVSPRRFGPPARIVPLD